MSSKILLALLFTIALVGPSFAEPSKEASAPPATDGLEPPSAFADIEDPAARSAALFGEASKALLHPRCVNCHPSGPSPLQGEDGRLHEPPVPRGAGGFGAAAMRCGTCHLKENFEPGRVPGAPMWHLAPAEMAWEGLSPGELCAQIKDPERNGNRSLKEIVEHMSEDRLVGWAWSPGESLEPPPGSQEALGELILAWAESGAACPE